MGQVSGYVCETSKVGKIRCSFGIQKENEKPSTVALEKGFHEKGGLLWSWLSETVACGGVELRQESPAKETLFLAGK